MPTQTEAFTSVRIFEAILSKVENPGSSSPAAQLGHTPGTGASAAVRRRSRWAVSAHASNGFTALAIPRRPRGDGGERPEGADASRP
jgi:hypothetical protein